MTDKPRVEVLLIEQGATTDPDNVNKHTQKGRKLVENSLQKRGAFRSIASAGMGVDIPTVYAGNLTLQTAVEAGFKEIINIHVRGDQLVNVVRDDIAPGSPEAIALGLEDNESGKQSYSPDIDVLAALAAGDNAILAALRNSDKIFDGMLDGMGMKGESADAEPQIDRAAELLEKWKVCTGDLWQIGEHRLLCGDSTKREDVERVTGGEKATLVMADPPYNVQYTGGSSNEKERDDSYKDDMTDVQYTEWLRLLLKNGFENSDGTSALLLWFSTSKMRCIMDGFESAGWQARILIVWNKLKAHYGALGAQYKQRFEPVWYCFKRGNAPRFYGETNECTVWDYEQPHINDLHPTMKPVDVYERCVRNHSQQGGEVLELFAGSGTTMVACQNLNRKCRAIEISPAYCSVILERMTTAFPDLEIVKLS
jgi:DNA modification methylase